MPKLGFQVLQKVGKLGFRFRVSRLVNVRGGGGGGGGGWYLLLNPKP